eukprot:gene31135-53390_t
MHGRIADETLVTFVADMSDLTELKRLFHLEYGRVPLAGELESLAEEQWTARRSTNQMFVESISRGFNNRLDLLKDASLEFVVPAHPTQRFGTGDSPVVVSNQQFLSMGPLGGVPLGDASLVYMPLRRDLAAAVTHGAPRVLEANGLEIVRLNTRLAKDLQREQLSASVGLGSRFATSIVKRLSVATRNCPLMANVSLAIANAHRGHSTVLWCWGAPA